MIKTYTEEEIRNIVAENITRDRMVSFLSAAVQWGTNTGMSPAILAEGQRMLSTLINPPAGVKPTEPEKPDEEEQPE